MTAHKRWTNKALLLAAAGLTLAGLNGCVESYSFNLGYSDWGWAAPCGPPAYAYVAPPVFAPASPPPVCAVPVYAPPPCAAPCPPRHCW